MGICDEFISDEQLAQIRIDYGAGLCREEWLRIRDCRFKEAYTEFFKIPDFNVRAQDLRWVIY